MCDRCAGRRFSSEKWSLADLPTLCATLSNNLPNGDSLNSAIWSRAAGHTSLRYRCLPSMIKRLFTMSVRLSMTEFFASRSANAGLYWSRSSRVTPCQIGRMTFLPGSSFAKSALSSCSVHFLFIQKGSGEYDDAIATGGQDRRSISLRKLSPHSSVVLWNETEIPAVSRLSPMVRHTVCRLWNVK